MFKSSTYRLGQQVIRFRRFTGKRYAAFCSIHREVSIGHVCATISECQLRKSGKILKNQIFKSLFQIQIEEDCDLNKSEIIQTIADTIILQDRKCNISAIAIFIYNTLKDRLFLLYNQNNLSFFISNNYPFFISTQHEF